jgi:hypothetical protein
MPLKNRSLRYALLGGAALTLVSLIGVDRAQASPLMPGLGDTVNVATDTLVTNTTATINFPYLPNGNQSMSVYASPSWFSGTFGPTHTAFSNLLVYCTDLYDYSTTPTTYTVGTLTNSHQPNNNPETALTTGQVNKIATLIAANYADTTATQLAIWSVEYGDLFSFSNTASNIVTDVKNELDGLDGKAPANVALYQLQENGVQGFVYISPIPEPISVAMLGLGMIGIGAVRRRRMRCPEAIA